MIESLITTDLAIFKTYPHLRKPMTDAFDFAWSVLKALPEQQGFFEARSSFRPRTYGDAPIDPVQYRTGTIHPAILRLMRENQAKEEGFNPRDSVSTDTRIRHPDEVSEKGYLQGAVDEDDFISAVLSEEIRRRGYVDA